MGIFGRFVMYKFDSLFMVLVIGAQLFLFHGTSPFDHDPDRWLKLLLQTGGNLWLITVIGAAGYWAVVDFHPALETHRHSRIVMAADGSTPDIGTRLLRSFIKAFTLFGGEWLLLYPLFKRGHPMVHDRVSGTERVAPAA